jgi:uncharacterized protein YbaR (Trm112 family)
MLQYTKVCDHMLSRVSTKVDFWNSAEVGIFLEISLYFCGIPRNSIEFCSHNSAEILGISRNSGKKQYGIPEEIPVLLQN